MQNTLKEFKKYREGDALHVLSQGDKRAEEIESENATILLSF